MRPVRYTAGVAAVLIYGLIVLGAVVRTTNSGLSCPDWPTCYGHWLPLPADIAAVPNIGYAYHQVMLEWVHRLIAGVFLGPLVLILAGLTFWYRRLEPQLPVLGGLLILLLLVQGILGGVTVLDRNSPWSVAVHLGNALLVLTVTLRIFRIAVGWPAPVEGRGIGVLAAVAWGFALLAMMSAAMTAKSGSSLACATWPLCNGEIIPDLADGGVRIHFIHRILAACTGLALLVLFWRSRMTPGLPEGARSLAALAAALVIVQIGLGALVIVLEVPIANAVLHQAVGVLTFAIVTLLMWRCLPLGRGAEARLGERNGLALRSA
ncbi:COX15/CtaA family protein [Benzoatithermus flavus]|uniref:COX15/CtaA family protein n=1 Tax=Benzoatithermus flavus TaxID=3108223 RepID=A0ABU8XLK5_9PROT